MKTKTTLLFVFVCSVCSVCFGQNFTGKIIDEKNGSLSFANIIARDKGGNPLIIRFVIKNFV